MISELANNCWHGTSTYRTYHQPLPNGTTCYIQLVAQWASQLSGTGGAHLYTEAVYVCDEMVMKSGTDSLLIVCDTGTTPPKNIPMEVKPYIMAAVPSHALVKSIKIYFPEKHCPHPHYSRFCGPPSHQSFPFSNKFLPIISELHRVASGYFFYTNTSISRSPTSVTLPFLWPCRLQTWRLQLKKRCRSTKLIPRRQAIQLLSSRMVG